MRSQSVSHLLYSITPAKLIMIVCSACGQSYSIMGYTQHVYSTSRTACIQAYEWNLELEDSEDGLAQSINDDPAAFMGDLFGEWDEAEYQRSKDGCDEDEDDHAEGMSTLLTFLFIDTNVHFTQTLKMNVSTMGPLTLTCRCNSWMSPMTKPLVLQTHRHMSLKLRSNIFL
jgi:hypothetical protein